MKRSSRRPATLQSLAARVVRTVERCLRTTPEAKWRLARLTLSALLEEQSLLVLPAAQEAALQRAVLRLPGGAFSSSASHPTHFRTRELP